MGQGKESRFFLRILFAEKQQKCFAADFIPCDESRNGLSVRLGADGEDIAMDEHFSVFFVKSIHFFQYTSAVSTDF